jgi:pimeloyl-ACP methyl ester carboxylesterase
MRPTIRTLSLISLLLPGIAFAQDSWNQEEWYLWADDGVRLYVTELGHAVATGDTVIVLHGGWGAEHSYLLEAVQPLADRYHFVLYDQRGSLRSPAPDSTITYERMVADLEALREELGLDEVALLTHSMGTALAYLYLAEHPDRVRGLVFTGPVPPIATPEDAAAVGADTSRVRTAREAWRAEAETHVVTEIEEEDLDRDPLSSKERTYKWRIGFTGFNAYHVERWRQMKGGMAFYNPSVVQALQANTSEDWSNLLARHRAPLEAFGGPIRVVLGDFDFTDPGAFVWPHIVKRLLNGRVTILEDAGHNAWLDQPETFVEAVDAALMDATQ